jgi:hypothetical protein
VDGYGSTIRLRDARRIEVAPTAALWVPEHGRPPRLSLYALGRYSDGWLAAEGLIALWPETTSGRVSGWLSMRLSAPPRTQNTLRFRQGGHEVATVNVRPGSPVTVRLRICAVGETNVAYRSKHLLLVGSRPAGVKSTAPVFTPDEAACAPTRAASSPV